MATRKRKTRKLRGSRTHGWGQVGQHRASGHKGGLGVSGMLKHHYSTMLKEFPDHFGHSSTHNPQPIIIEKWTNVRDLDDIYAKSGKQEDNKKVIDLRNLGYDKLLGGGKLENAYTVKINRVSESAREKITKAGGEVLAENG
jgi:large subunit ribosomal protein L15